MSDLLGATAINAGGGILGAIINGAQAAEARELQKKMYEEQFAYAQEQDKLRMQREDNAIQRQMADLRAAGINPLLAGQMGGAMSAAGGTLPSMYQPIQNNVGDIIAGIRAGDALTKSYDSTTKRMEAESKIALNEQQKKWLDTHIAEVEQYMAQDKDIHNAWKKMNEGEQYLAAKFIEQIENEAIGEMRYYAEKGDEQATKIIRDFDKGEKQQAIKEAFAHMNQKEGYNEAMKNMVEKIELGFRDSTGEQVRNEIWDLAKGIVGNGAGEAMTYARESRLHQEAINAKNVNRRY